MGQNIFNSFKRFHCKFILFKMKTFISLSILLLAAFMVSCREIKLESGVGLESGTGAEARWWPWTNCQTQTEMSPDCCIWRRCNWICGMTPQAAQSSCFMDCDHICPQDSLGWGCSVIC